MSESGRYNTGSLAASGIDRCGLCRRDERFFRQQGTNDHPKRQIVLLPEALMPDLAVPTDEDGGGGSLHPIALHGHGYRRSIAGFIHTNGECQPVFVDEGFKRNRRHGGMVFKHRVQADHRQVSVAEQAMRPFRLRGAMRNTARTQHLESMQKDNATAKRGQLQGHLRIEPSGNY